MDLAAASSLRYAQVECYFSIVGFISGKRRMEVQVR